MNNGTLFRIVVGQLNADGKPLHDLDEIARRVLRRQQRKSCAGSHRESGNAALELLPVAIHVDLATHALADALVGQLRFLEVGVDPDLGERTHGHQALTNLDIIPWIDVAAGDLAVDFAHDVAVAEVQLGFSQIVLGLSHLGLGLLDGRRLGNQPLEDPVQILVRILRVKRLLELLRRRHSRSAE